LAYVAKTPGKTRALNFYEIDRRCYFVDLPGYGFARVSKQEQLAWRNLIDLYIEHTKTIKGVIHVIDSRRGLTADDLELINYIRAPYSRFFLVLSKSDKLSNQEKKNVYTDTLDRLTVRRKI
jgi:GTP-binding protein